MERSIQERKAVMRKEALARRAEAHRRDNGNGVANLMSVLRGHRGKVIAGYLPIGSEIDPRPAMEEASAFSQICVPVIVGPGQPLKFVEWTSGCRLKRGAFGVDIPVDQKELVPEVVVVPLVAFDNDGNRLGYGGGFYDRTLKQLNDLHPILSIGFAYSAQEEVDIPTEATDISPDIFVTDISVGPL